MRQTASRTCFQRIDDLTETFAQFWFFHLVNFVLAAVMYTMIGRLILGLFVPENWDNYIWRAFVRISDPVLNVVRAVTPLAVPPIVTLIFAVMWMFVLRLAFFAAAVAFGFAPTA